MNGAPVFEAQFEIPRRVSNIAISCQSLAAYHSACNSSLCLTLEVSALAAAHESAYGTKLTFQSLTKICEKAQEGCSDGGASNGSSIF